MAVSRKIRVAIRLDSPSVGAAGYNLRQLAENPDALAYQERLRQEQQEVIGRIESATGEPLEVKRRMTRTANVISAEVRLRDLPLIAAVEGVAGVAAERQYRIDPPVDRPVTK